MLIMKKHFAFLILCTCIASCTAIDDDYCKEERLENSIYPQKTRNLESQFPLSIDEQDDLFFEFVSLFNCQEVRHYFLGNEDSCSYQERWHAILNFEEGSSLSANEELNNILNQNGFDYFKSLIDNYCTNNYLNFNIYIPHYPTLHSTFHDNVPIYFANALYSDALDSRYEDINETSQTQSISYAITYIVENDEIVPIDMHIDENFCYENIVIFVSFRDYIVDWNHFSKGTQSISDWLLSVSLEYQGYGCSSVEELLTEGTMLCGKLTFPILHSKKTFKKPCDENYDHFCKLGKPEELEYNTDLFSSWEYDPYRTSWIQLEEGQYDQYIPITSNPMTLDLTGHDFPIEEMVIESNGRNFYIPQQISTYDPETNSQHFVMYF